MSTKKTYAVFGLGRYGIAVANELVRNGMEVIAVDLDEKSSTPLPMNCRCANAPMLRIRM